MGDVHDPGFSDIWPQRPTSFHHVSYIVLQLSTKCELVGVKRRMLPSHVEDGGVGGNGGIRGHRRWRDSGGSDERTVRKSNEK